MRIATVKPSQVLHALRICGFGSADRLASFVRQPVGQVEESLKALETDGLVRYRTGRISGWLLTPAGRTVHENHIATALEDHTWQQAVLAGYRGFLERNWELKQICTAWQLKQGPDGHSTTNDHADADYDRRVIDDLSALHTLAEAMLEQLAQGQVRFADYNLRLADALMRLRAGDNRAFATPMSASYHCIWMELHEDLLVTLGRERDEADGN
jgi:hypothetical protein